MNPWAIGVPSNLRLYGSCARCAARIEVPGDVLCEACLKTQVSKQEDLRRIEESHRAITLESVQGQWFAGEEPSR